MELLTKTNITLSVLLVVAIILSILLGFGAVSTHMSMDMGGEMEKVESYMTQLGSTEYNKEIIKETQNGITTLIADGRYKCCLESSCTYCFLDSEHQDRELVCDCLVDIMNGKHPCGECIGEILEGKGNKLIAEYFATSIAEKVGKSHLATLQKIIEEEYGVQISQQL